MSTCFFTGHREMLFDDGMSDAIDEQLEGLVREGILEYVTGGIPGWDMLCAMKILRMKERRPEVRLTLVIPCPPEEYCTGWSLEHRFFFNAIYHGADRIEQLCSEYHVGCGAQRNYRLAELSDICLCFCDPHRSSGNTAQAICCAERRGLRMIEMYGRK